MLRNKGLISRLKRVRELAGASRRELSVLAGLSQAHLGMIERNPGASPTAETVEKVAEVLGITLDWLIAGKGADPLAADLKAALKAARARGPKGEEHRAGQLRRAPARGQAPAPSPPIPAHSKCSSCSHTKKTHYRGFPAEKCAAKGCKCELFVPARSQGDAARGPDPVRARVRIARSRSPSESPPASSRRPPITKKGARPTRTSSTTSRSRKVAA